MSERKKWSKQPHFTPSNISTGGSTTDAVAEKQRQYIKMLEERNRMKKRLADKANTGKQQELQEREHAFTTTFNVPSTTQSTANLETKPQTAPRKPRTAASLLPTKLQDKDGSRSCRSAPLNPAQRTKARAKWSKPKGEIQVEHLAEDQGMAVLKFVDETEDQDGNEGGQADILEVEGQAPFEAEENDLSTRQFLDIEDEYMEEDFEDFEEEKQAIASAISNAEVAMPTQLAREETLEPVIEVPQRQLKLDPSETTSRLVDIIQKLSHSKQERLMEVLDQFQSSEQDQDDVDVLRSSIDDPRLWKELNSTLFASPKRQCDQLETSGADVLRKTLAAEQAREEALAEERRAKEKMQEEEEKRLAMIKQLEDEERELEMLLEQKRQERLAQATQNEVVLPTHPSVLKVDKQIISPSKTLDKESPQPSLKSSELSEASKRKLSDLMLEIPFLERGGSSDTEVRIKLLSSWGGSKAIGLSRICCYDADGNEIVIDISTLRVYTTSTSVPLAPSHELVRTARRLCDRSDQTRDESKVWVGRLSDNGTLQIAFCTAFEPTKLCLWNYNGKLHGACARDVEVAINSKCVWIGSLPETYGGADENICTWIDLASSSKRSLQTSKPRVLSTARPRQDSDEIDAAGSDTARTEMSIDSNEKDGRDIGGGDMPLWLSSTRQLNSSGLLDPHEASNRPKRRSWESNDLSATDSDGRDNSRSLRRSQVRTQSRENDDAKVVPIMPESGHSRMNVSYDPAPSPRTPPYVSDDSLDLLNEKKDWNEVDRYNARQTGSDTYAISTGAPMDMNENLETSFTTSELLTRLRADPYASKRGLPFAMDEKPGISIPELPRGSGLLLEIFTTWGDSHYVGLNGIEAFNEHGELVQFRHPGRQVTANPHSINVLQEYDDDPRVPQNLVDGVNLTSDDRHMWLAPFSLGDVHSVTLSFEHECSISMVRIWNYNKSRTHTFRGARQVRLSLLRPKKGKYQGDMERMQIFDGEIRRASGLVSSEAIDSACEVVLFTSQEDILQQIEANDPLVASTLTREKDQEDKVYALQEHVHKSLELHRPRTSEKEDIDKATSPQGNQRDGASLSRHDRPLTAAMPPPPTLLTNTSSGKLAERMPVREPEQQSPVTTKSASVYEECDASALVTGRKIAIRLLETWGDRDYIGLTQLDVLVGVQGTPYSLMKSHIDATPRDLVTLGYVGDPRTIDKLVDCVGTTCDDTHMWLIPFTSRQEIRIDLGEAQALYGLRIWNYNKNAEDTYRGVKQIQVLVDDRVISPAETGYLLRKAPGHVDYDFHQLLRFDPAFVATYASKLQCPMKALAYKTPIVRQDYEPWLLPQGFTIRLVCWTTWGDPYYIGLDGIELYNADGGRLIETPHVITANPFNVSDSDARIPSNLLSGRDKASCDPQDTWLAPFASSLNATTGNIIEIVFDIPVRLSLIKVWNYSKTATRGVRDVSIFVDDHLVYSGEIQRCQGGGETTSVALQRQEKQVIMKYAQPILFSSSQAQADTVKRQIVYCGNKTQDVLGINEGQVALEARSLYEKPDPSAEGVYIDMAMRPTTALC